MFDGVGCISIERVVKYGWWMSGDQGANCLEHLNDIYDFASLLSFFAFHDVGKS